MEKDRPLKNALNEISSQEKGKREKELRDDVERPVREKADPPKEDVVDKLLRGFVAFFVAVFISAVVAGILEAAQGWEISFGSLPMISITALLYYPSYKVLTWLGFFRQK